MCVLSGGHPVNWEKIVSVCVSVLKELNAGVQETNWKILANAPLRQPEKSSSNTSRRDFIILPFYSFMRFLNNFIRQLPLKRRRSDSEVDIHIVQL